MLQDEVDFVKREMGHGKTPEEEYGQAWAAAENELIWLPSQAQHGRAVSASTTER